MLTAPKLLERAAQIMTERASTYDQPDADITVLIESEEADGAEVWMGFYSGDDWMTIDCLPVDVKVIAWAEMPAGSRAQLRAQL